MRYKYIFIIIYILTSVSLLTPKASAESVGLKINPSIISLNLSDSDPSTVMKNITIENSGSEEESIYIEYVPFKTDSKGNITYEPEDEATYEYINTNLNIIENGQKISTLDIAPKQKKTITIELNGTPLPRNVNEYSFTIFFHPRSSEKDTDLSSINNPRIQLNTKASIGVHILIKNLSNNTMPTEINTPDKSTIYFHSKPSFLLSAYNPNAYHVINSLNISIYNILGQKIYANEKDYLLIPSNSSLSLNSDRLINNNTLLPWNSTLLPGFYTVELIIDNKVDNVKTTYKKNITVIPLNVVLVIPIILFSIGLIIKTKRYIFK